ncbi:MAG: T9SS type A sorting domain-containing protein, partial [Bacteroidales bacterium]|nr:T9SS type A sorting domain-containing protein [Bacteroidales bacterium]
TNKTYSAPQSYMFIKIAEMEQDTVGMGTNLQYHCWFDQDYENRQVGSLGNGHIMLDVTELSDGMHTVNVMLEGNVMSAPMSYMFIKVAPSVGTEPLQYQCWFDRDYSTLQSGMLGSGTFNLDVSALSNGLHTVNIQLYNGTYTAANSYMFYKIPVGGTKIKRWEYFLNGDYDNNERIDLDPALSDLSIMTLLPVETQPLRSMCFEYDANDGDPVIYAKNEITFRFWATDDRFIDKTEFYVDENVSQDVVADVMEPNTSELIIKPVDNEIRWFKVMAQVGDSLTFKADKACTMQLFAPSGEEVYNVSGQESIRYGGRHAWEDGYYYLAVHDVMGSGSTVNVSYQHIEKYALLAYTPHNIGNKLGNIFVMDYFGNGFNFLNDVKLVSANDTLSYDEILNKERTEASVKFQFANSIPNGKYDLYFTFVDNEEVEHLKVEDAVVLEDINYGEKLITVTEPARMAKPYPIVITVENTGNVDLMYVPFNIAFTKQDVIENIDFADFYISIPKEKDSLGYGNIMITKNLLNKNEDGCIMYMYIPYLKANESLSYTLDVTAPGHTRFKLYTWAGEGCQLGDIYDTNTEDVETRNEQARNMMEMTGLANDIVGQIPNNGPLGNATAVADNTVRNGVALGNLYGAIGYNRDKAVLSASGIDPSDPLYGDILERHGRLMTPGEILGGNLGELLDRLMGFQRDGCESEEPNPGNPTEIEIVVPGDPNDIYGYTAESGSKFMRQDIQKINYEIEFENDTTLANAAAHTIVVTDTLDANRFDLSSLSARGVTIGEKMLQLNGEQNFVYTLDLRPENYVIAQIQQEYDVNTGVIKWTISSLDPMTMEPATDPDQGALPVNYYGDGVGTLNYSINLKDTFDDGTEISNRACIVFDLEAAIVTPTWTNIVDAVNPVSQIESVVPFADSLQFIFNSEDNRSGVWYHTLYHRNDSTNAEWKILQSRIFEDSFTMKLESLQTTDYLVMATDSAGNNETKALESEYLFTLDSLNYYDLQAYSTNEFGEVLGSGVYVENSDIKIEGVPSEGYHFVQWNDFNTENPRTVHITQDSTFIAQFAINQYNVELAVQDTLNMGTVEGSGVYEHNEIVNVIADSNKGYIFLYWLESDTIASTEAEFSFEIKGDRNLTAVFGPADAHYTMLKKGWNWYSTYIDAGRDKAYEKLTDGLDTNGVVIKSQTKFATYYEGYDTWDGSLTEVDNKNMYMIDMSAEHYLMMDGSISNVSQTSMSLKPGWNWISYPINKTQTLNRSLQGFTPKDGDYFKSQTGYATYYEGYGWDGSLLSLEPGQGYMYKNNDTVEKTLTYSKSYVRKNKVKNITTDGNYWQADVNKYPNNMNITAVAMIDGVEQMSDNLEIGVFADGECRGSAKAVYKEMIDRYVFYLTVYGEGDEELTFRLYDADMNDIQEADATMSFDKNATIGNINNSHIINFTTMDIDEYEVVESDAIYPNPVDSGETVYLDKKYEEVEVINSLGVTVKVLRNTNKIVGIDEAGVYIIKTINDKSISYQKLIVK